jgi:hypothetical protein
MFPFHTLFKIVPFQTEIKSTKTMRLSHKKKKTASSYDFDWCTKFLSKIDLWF